jgi:uncharacterized membrane protein (UPF0136 family)
MLQAFFYLYGALTMAGGVMGYVSAGSQVSLVAGLASGAIILMATYLRARFAGLAAIVLALTSALLLAKFGKDLLAGAGFMPAGLMASLSGLALLAVGSRLVVSGNTKA